MHQYEKPVLRSLQHAMLNTGNYISGAGKAAGSYFAGEWKRTDKGRLIGEIGVTGMFSGLSIALAEMFLPVELIAHETYIPLALSSGATFFVAVNIELKERSAEKAEQKRKDDEFYRNYFVL